MKGEQDMVTAKSGFCAALLLLVASYASPASAQGGVVYISYPESQWTSLRCMDIDSNGTIFATGYTDVAGKYDFLDVSVLADGRANPDFGGGMVRTNVGETIYDNDYAYTCVLQPDVQINLSTTRIAPDQWLAVVIGLDLGWIKVLLQRSEVVHSRAVAGEWLGALEVCSSRHEHWLRSR